MFYKRLEDGTISYGPTVYAPGYTLDDKNRESRDGWVWCEDDASIKTALKIGDLELANIRGPITEEHIKELIIKERLSYDKVDSIRLS